MAVISNNADLNNIIHAMDYPWIYKYRGFFNLPKVLFETAGNRAWML